VLPMIRRLRLDCLDLDKQSDSTKKSRNGEACQ
jgi:hypothetical protein